MQVLSFLFLNKEKIIPFPVIKIFVKSNSLQFFLISLKFSTEKLFLLTYDVFNTFLHKCFGIRIFM